MRVRAKTVDQGLHGMELKKKSKLWKVSEVATMLDVTNQYVYKRISDKAIPHVEFRGSKFIPDSYVEQLRASGKIKIEISQSRKLEVNNDVIDAHVVRDKFGRAVDEKRKDAERKIPPQVEVEKQQYALQKLDFL